MLPHKHLAISTIVGAAAWWQTGTAAAMGAALAGGVLPDLDHVVDYAYYYWRRKHRLILPLHGYEYAVVGLICAVLWSAPLIAVATLSYFIHLLADQVENQTNRFGYSILYRTWQRFRLEQISASPVAAARGREDDIRMLVNLLGRFGIRDLRKGEG